MFFQTWTIRVSCLVMSMCMCVYVIQPSQISIMINVESAVLLLDAKIYEAEDEKSSLIVVPLFCFCYNMHMKIILIFADRRKYDGHTRLECSKFFYHVSHKTQLLPRRCKHEYYRKPLYSFI